MALDCINSIYVAFTRAVDELRIFLPRPARTDSVSPVTSHFQALSTLPGRFGELIRDDSENGLFLPPGMIMQESDGYHIGEPPVTTEAEESGTPPVTITDYPVNSLRDILRYRESTAPSGEEDEDPDPRSEGNVLHGILAAMRTADDLDRALGDCFVRGTITATDRDRYRDLLREALSRPLPSQWFAPGLRVLNERSILIKKGSNRRPDRIVADKEGNAIVIDYKFGAEPDDGRHRRQVAGYVGLLRSIGVFASVQGYVWYPRTGTVVSAG